MTPPDPTVPVVVHRRRRRLSRRIAAWPWGWIAFTVVIAPVVFFGTLWISYAYWPPYR